MVFVLHHFIVLVESFFLAKHIWCPSGLRFDELAAAHNAMFQYRAAKSHAVITLAGSLCVVDTRLEPAEQRVVAAHELAHVIMHRGNQLCMARPFRMMQETEATVLAGHIFAPDYLLSEYLYDAPPSYNGAIAYLARTFQVTYEAMRKRYHEFMRNRRTKTVAAVAAEGGR